MSPISISFLVVCLLSAGRVSSQAAIVCPANAPPALRLAARELHRYVYLRTDQLLPMVERLPDRGDTILLATDPSLQPQQYTLKTTTGSAGKSLLITGGSDVAVLYGAYHWVEKLGVRFGLHGDVIPDEKIALVWPELDETHGPLFEWRGLNPWGSHAEGIDLWNTDDWKQVFVQMTKLRMNFLGVHSYPEKGGQYDSEPTVWIGLPGDYDAKGRVKSSFSSSFFNTRRTQWGYLARPTSAYRFGASQLFERDDWGSDVMLGQCPVPTTMEGCNAVFDRTGRMFAEAFALARQLGVKTCIGTEGPLRIPAPVKERLLRQGKDPKDPAVVREVYEGMFRRIAATHPLDYYWIWTPESWLWEGNTAGQTQTFVEDFQLARQAAGAAFELATCGWVLGPAGDRSAWYRFLPADVCVSALSEAYTGPVDPAFRKVVGRDKWAIPWMEEDTGTGILGPQLWVARIRKDAADALAYGCTGLMGLHWRTHEIEPVVLALSRACWNQIGWNPQALNDPPGVPASLRYEGPVPPRGKGVVGTATVNDPIAGTDDDTLYQNYRHNLRGYQLKIPKGRYRVTLQFCEPQYRADGKRVFDVQLQDRTVLEKLDIHARAGYRKALDLSFDDVAVADGWLHVGLENVQAEPCISAIVVQGNNFTRKINCGGMSYQDYEADPPRTPTFSWGPQGTAYERRGLDCSDLYEDWARHSFGPQVGPGAAKIFAKLDGQVPLVSGFDGGAGALWPDSRPWSLVAGEFTFLDEFAQLRPQVQGAGNRERFDFWLNLFQHLYAQARVRCVWGRLNLVVGQAQAEPDLAKRRAIIETQALVIRDELTRSIEQAYESLLAMVDSPGGLATVINWEGHVYKRLVKERDEVLTKLYGQPVESEVRTAHQYRGRPRLIVPTVRTLASEGEALTLKVIVLDNDRPAAAALNWRPMGRGAYRQIALQHVGRGVHRVILPPAEDQSIEHYLTATTVGGQQLCWPATAPRINQTVVVIPAARP